MNENVNQKLVAAFLHEAERAESKGNTDATNTYIATLLVKAIVYALRDVATAIRERHISD